MFDSKVLSLLLLLLFNGSCEMLKCYACYEHGQRCYNVTKVECATRVTHCMSHTHVGRYDTRTLKKCSESNEEEEECKFRKYERGFQCNLCEKDYCNSASADHLSFLTTAATASGLSLLWNI